MTRLPMPAVVAASMMAAVSLLTACGSGARAGYPVAAVRAAFNSQGIDLNRFRFVDGKPAGGEWVDLIGKRPYPIHVNVRLGPLVGAYRHVSNQPAAEGLTATQYRNVLVVWPASDRAIVTAALHRLK